MMYCIVLICTVRTGACTYTVPVLKVYLTFTMNYFRLITCQYTKWLKSASQLPAAVFALYQVAR